MNIGLNLIGFTPGEMGGVETYFRNLLKYLQKIDKNNIYTLLYDERSSGYFHLSNPVFSSKLFNNKRGSIDRFVRGILKRMIKVDLQVLRIDDLCLDIIHHPFSTLSHLDLKTPGVLTFHDMQHEFYPEFFSPRELQNRKRNYQISAEKSEHIIAISEYSKQSLIERYHIPAEKIDVVYSGYSDEYHVIDDQKGLNMIKELYNLSKPFIYYPAATWPHKNHKRLLIAIQILKKKHNFDGALVLTGTTKQIHTDILSEVERLGINKIVRFLGYLPYDHLPYIYNLARMMAFPSLFEGLGIPLVEAMACGCPVVCSNVTSIPEVVGDAGVMFNPVNSEEIANKIWSVWVDEEKRAKMRLLGLERARIFNWQHAIKKTLEVYFRTLKKIK